MYRIGNLGHSAILLPASLILFVILAATGRRRDAVAFAIALAMCLVTTLATKLGFHACDAGEAFDVTSPSGHASLSATFYGCLALIVGGGRPARERAIVYAGAALLVVLVGISRILVLAHTWPEVVIGTGIGVVAVLVFGLLRGPARPVAIPAAALVVGVPIAAVLVVAILNLAGWWTPEPLIEAAARRLDALFRVCQ